MRSEALPLADRAVAPDLARGAMLLLVALANVHLYLYGRPLGVRLYPADPTGADRAVTLLQMLLVDGRAYPLFGLLFGYGIGQLAARRAGGPAAGGGGPAGAGPANPARGGVDVGSPTTALVQRRGLALVGIGVAHVALAWSGDVVAAYGLLALLLAGLLVTGTAVSLLTTAVVGVLVETVLGAFSAVAPRGSAPLPSVAVADPAAAVVARLAEWGRGTLVGSLVALAGAVAFGVWAARHRLLDGPAGEPPPGGTPGPAGDRGRGRALLARVAVAGVAAAVLGGAPLALAAAGLWRPGAGALLLAGMLHTLGGFAGGLGYAAAFGLLGLRADGARPGVVTRALAACGQRSLSCYLGQSALFAALLPAWTLGWGARLGVAQAALLAVAVWSVLLLAAVASAGAGYRGPAEVVLRRLTYGARP